MVFEDMWVVLVVVDFMGVEFFVCDFELVWYVDVGVGVGGCLGGCVGCIGE